MIAQKIQIGAYPLDLVDHYATTTRKKSLGTKDSNEAKRLMWPVIELWNAEFDDIRSRRAMTADDKAHATWRHYKATLQRDDKNRLNYPTAGDIEVEKAKIVARINAGEITNTEPLTVFDATLDLAVLKNARQFDEQIRRTNWTPFRNTWCKAHVPSRSPFR